MLHRTTRKQSVALGAQEVGNNNNNNDNNNNNNNNNIIAEWMNGMNGR